MLLIANSSMIMSIVSCDWESSSGEDLGSILMEISELKRLECLKLGIE